MKKVLVVVFLFISLAVYSQKEYYRPFYGSFDASLATRNATTSGYSIGADAGAKIEKIFGAGFGIEAAKFKGHKSVYLPVYGDVRYFFPPGSILQVFFTAQAGYGFYNSKQSHVATDESNTATNSTLTGKGGFYYGSGLGISGRDKYTPVVTLRYTSYAFNFTRTGSYYHENGPSRLNAITMSFGFSF